ncbi:cell wall integrity and stress response component 3-like [Harpegnathos saltator]|uniref:cell wall integrity and stress response component 3-like n=1 Tax=Harpegnathos saltator TaxID=610380 RepID=UPI000DBEE115|nr:cell wall integrity and stress response component 3-like [Harpegnathos saltator]
MYKRFVFSKSSSSSNSSITTTTTTSTTTTVTTTVTTTTNITAVAETASAETVAAPAETAAAKDNSNLIERKKVNRNSRSRVNTIPNSTNVQRMSRVCLEDILRTFLHSQNILRTSIGQHVIIQMAPSRERQRNKKSRSRSWR